jgi:hypothetical protein
LDAVGHEAIGPTGDAIGVAALGERQLPAIAALGDVMRRSWDDDAGEARHAEA